MEQSRMAPVFQLRKILRPGQHFHFARSHIDRAAPFDVHGHDFGECFLIESGEGVHRLDGREAPVRPGDSLWIHPGDVHGFDGRGLVVANFAFPHRETMAFLGNYLDPLPAFFRRSARARPVCFPTDFREWFSLRTARLGNARARYDFDLFLLEWLGAAGFVKKAAVPASLPEWLARVVQAASDPAVFRHGTRGLLEICGRSAEHLAREARHHLGKTPTMLINEGRLAYAARRLEITQDDPGEIATACGFRGPAHFYALFKARYEVSPVRYRAVSRRMFGSGG